MRSAPSGLVSRTTTLVGGEWGLMGRVWYLLKHSSSERGEKERKPWSLQRAMLIFSWPIMGTVSGRGTNGGTVLWLIWEIWLVCY